MLWTEKYFKIFSAHKNRYRRATYVSFCWGLKIFNSTDKCLEPKLSVNKNLIAAIKKSVLQQLTISIEAENLGKVS